MPEQRCHCRKFSFTRKYYLHMPHPNDNNGKEDWQLILYALNSCFSNAGRSVFHGYFRNKMFYSLLALQHSILILLCPALPCLPCPSSVNKQAGKEFQHVRNFRLFKQLEHLTLPRFMTELSCCPDVRSFVIFWIKDSQMFWIKSWCLKGKKKSPNSSESC